jgi:hypothetical protein
LQQLSSLNKGRCRETYIPPNKKKQITRRGTARDVFDGEERHEPETGLEAESEGPRIGVEHGNGPQYGDERESDEHGDKEHKR